MKFFYLNKPALFLLFFFLIIENAQAQITFAPAPASPFATITGGGLSQRRMKTADFNKDGIQDVVASTDIAVGVPLRNLAVVLGTYTGAMAAPVLYSVPATPIALAGIATADFDGDGDIDIATIGTDKNLYILKNNFPVVGFAAAASFSTSTPALYNSGFTELEATDYDQDGDVDLLTVAQNTTNGVVFILYRNDGNGQFLASGGSGIITFTAPPAISFSAEHQIKVGIFDGTNVELLYVNSTNNVYKISGLLTTAFISTIYTDPVPITSFKDMAIGDFNLDSNTDIAVTSYGASSFNNFFVVLIGDGIGAFALGFSTDFLPANAMGTGVGSYNILATDLNNDGKLDIVVSLKISKKILIYENTSFPNISFVRYLISDINTGTDVPKEISFGDFNSDGLPDIAAIFDVNDNARIYLNVGISLNPFADVCANVSGGNYLSSNQVSTTKRNDFTVEGWFKMTRLNVINDQYIFYNGKFGADGFGLYVENGGDNLFVSGNDGVANFSFPVTAKVVENQWTHFALVKDKNDNWKFYLDGRLSSSTPNNNHSIPSSNTFFGTDNGSSGNEMEGFLQEFRFWNTELDIKTIREYSHTQANNNHPKYFTLNSYYPLHDNGAEAKDIAFLTNRNAFHKNASFTISPSWSANIAPVGDGGSGITVGVPSGVFAFNARTTTGLEVDFDALSPNGDIVVSRVYDTPTNNLSSASNSFPVPTGAISRIVFSNIYWVVENYGSTTNFPLYLKEITFDIKDNQFNSAVFPLVSSYPATAPFPAVNLQANAFEIYARSATSNNASDWRRVGVCNAFGSVKARKPGSVISDFGRVQLVIGVDLTILPIHLASFSGKRMNTETNLIEWITTFEYKNQLFEIEKSFDAKEFFRIGTQKPTNKTTLTSYNFTDKYATEAAYYRLKQYDEDGKVNYSKIIFISNQKETNFGELSVYPNPVADEIRLKITGMNSIKDNDKTIQMQVFSTMGTKILDISGNLAEIEQMLNQNLAKMPSGLYMIQIQTENKIMKTKFIKK